MGKVAKARKSTHATKKATAKTRGKIIEDPNAEWEVESVGKLKFAFLNKSKSLTVLISIIKDPCTFSLGRKKSDLQRARQ